jgi:hypothetical protein
MYEGAIIAEREENCPEEELGLLMAGHEVGEDADIR